MKKVLVFGSANIDFLTKVSKLPKQGETIKAENLSVSFGGKGVNQAVAAANSGAKVIFVGAVGNDEHGKLIINNLEKNGIDSSFVQTIPDEISGLAMVLLHNKDNRIIINSGANKKISYLPEFDKLILNSDTILLQNEIPVEFNNQVIEKARELNKTIIFNPAPVEELGMLKFNYIDYFTPNEHEYEFLKSMKIDRLEEKAIVTLGADGASFNKEKFPAEKVKVVDTTGAGDTFNGYFASTLTKTNSVTQAIKEGLSAATESVKYLGAQSNLH